MNKKSFQIPEVIGTISWLIMDFCWLSKEYGIAVCCMLTVVAFLGIAVMNIFSTKNIRYSERFNYVAVWIWSIMNSFWMISDLPLEEESHSTIIALDLAKLCFMLGSIAILLSFVFSFIEKKQIVFRRLKITPDIEEEKTDVQNNNFELSSDLSNFNQKFKDSFK